jgi:hypothetical protein
MPLIRLTAAAILLAMSAAASASDKPVPEGLVCPAEAGGAELVSSAIASAEAGVSGFCVYYAYDEENPGRNVTMTLRIGTADFDPDAGFKKPKVERGGMSVVEETTRTLDFGGRAAPANVIVLAGKESGLGDITDVYNALYLFRLDGGRTVSLEEEYTNLSADLAARPRAALLGLQE